MEASRAAISASTRVRRNSSGLQRWVFAVTSSSGASRRIAAIFSRFSPAFRSAASGGGRGRSRLVPSSPRSVDRVGVQRPGRHRRQGQHSASLPGRPWGRARRRRWRGWSGCRRPATAGTAPPVPTPPPARRGRGRRRGRGCRRARCRAWSPRPRRRRSGTPPRPGRGRRNSFSAWVLGRGARRGLSGRGRS